MKTLLITGASGGIGRATARRLAASGYRLVLSGRDLDRLQETANQCGGNTHCVSADLTRPEQRAEVVRMAEALAIDGLINIAGINELALFEQMDAATIDAMIAANLLAPLHLTHELLPHLHNRPEAQIVNIGSAFGTIGFPGYVLYSTTKFALRGFSEALRRELADSRIAVKYVGPRATRTSLNDVRADHLNEALGNRVDPPEKVAALIERVLARPPGDYYLGWPERLFVRLNAVAPRLVSSALRGRLGTIRRYADNEVEQGQASAARLVGDAGESSPGRR